MQNLVIVVIVEKIKDVIIIFLVIKRLEIELGNKVVNFY